MDVLSFNALCGEFHGVLAAEKHERISLLRTSVWGDKKDMEKVTKALEKASGSTRKLGATEFDRAIGA